MCLLNKGYGRHVADEAKFLLRSHSDEAWGEKAEEDRGHRTEFCEEMRRGWKRRAEKRRLARKFSSRGVRGGLWGGPGRPLGGSGGVWEGLGGARGGSRALLGRSWGGFGAILEAILSPDDARSIFGPILVAKRVPQGRRFGSQNGAKIDPKTGSKFKSEKSASRRRLGAIWGRFLRPSGRRNVGFHARKRMFS